MVCGSVAIRHAIPRRQIHLFRLRSERRLDRASLWPVPPCLEDFSIVPMESPPPLDSLHLAVLVRLALPRRVALISLAFIRRKVGAIGVMKNQRADAGLRLHHHALGEADANLFGAQ